MSEYHKIETLYERDPGTFKVKPGVFKNRTYSLLKSWEWTEKIDGTNIRVMWDHLVGVVKFGGRTDKAQLHADLIRWLYENLSADKFKVAFPDVSAVIYGEGYGAGIQKGGGGYSQAKQFIAFDVVVDGKWWLNRESVEDVCAKLSLKSVPYLGTMTLEQATEMTRLGFVSIMPGATCQSEGMVGRPAEPLFDKRGSRLITKLKTKDF